MKIKWIERTGKSQNRLKALFWFLFLLINSACDSHSSSSRETEPTLKVLVNPTPGPESGLSSGSRQPSRTRNWLAARRSLLTQLLWGRNLIPLHSGKYYDFKYSSCRIHKSLFLFLTPVYWSPQGKYEGMLVVYWIFFPSKCKLSQLSSVTELEKLARTRSVPAHHSLPANWASTAQRLKVCGL